MGAAACRKLSAMAMAAMTIKAREMAEKFLRSFIFDELVKSRFPDGFVKSPRSRLANPEE
jgi:hypothetical protein